MNKNQTYWHKKLCSYCNHGCHPSTRSHLWRKHYTVCIKL